MAIPEPTSSMPLSTAQFILQQQKALEEATAAYSNELSALISPAIEAKNAEITSQYAPKIEQALETNNAEYAAQLEAQIVQEQAAAAQQIQRQGAAQLDQSRLQSGQPTSADIQRVSEEMAPKIQAATERDVQEQEFNSWREGVQRQIAPQEFNQLGRKERVLQELVQAGEDPEALKAFAAKVDSDQDPARKADTIAMLEDYGFSMPKGGGFYQNRDGGFTVQLPDGGSQVVATEEEAASLAGSGEPTLQTGDYFTKLRGDSITQIQNERAKLGEFLGVDSSQGGDTEAGSGSGDEATTPQPEGGVSDDFVGEATTAAAMGGAAGRAGLDYLKTGSASKFRRLRQPAGAPNAGALTKTTVPMTKATNVASALRAGAGSNVAGAIPGARAVLTGLAGKVPYADVPVTAVNRGAQVAPNAGPLAKLAGGTARLGGRVLPGVGGFLTGADIADDLGFGTTGKVVGAGLGTAASYNPYGLAFGTGYAVGDLIGLDTLGENVAGKIANIGVADETAKWNQYRADVNAARESGNTEVLRALVNAGPPTNESRSSARGPTPR